MEFFYKTHDPTTANRQGPDVGTQYRSAIFYHSSEQKEIAEKVTEQIQEKLNNEKNLYSGNKIVTEIVEAADWYDAEDYHQKYLVSKKLFFSYSKKKRDQIVDLLILLICKKILFFLFFPLGKKSIWLRGMNQNNFFYNFYFIFL